MQKLLGLFLFFTTVTLSCFAAACAAGDESPGSEGIMAPEELKRGMKGYGLTVFGGDKVESFDVEVLGVIKNRSVKRDLILIRASGGILEKSGVIAGMSGSPIYIEEKLIGALAYAWGFSKEAIAGVQPIGKMFELRDRKKLLSSRQGQEPSAVELSDHPHAPSAILQPLKTPIFFQGFSKEARDRLSKFFGKRGMLPICASASKISDAKSSKNAPLSSRSPETRRERNCPSGAEQRDFSKITAGQAVAANIMRGDMNVSAVGTLTHRSGKTILAFGHPFFSLGDTAIPLCRAKVETVLPSLALSFKLANTLEPIGAIHRDGATGIVAVLGERAPTAKVHFELLFPKRDEVKEYNFELAQHKTITPSMLQIALSSVLMEETRAMGPSTLKIEARAKFKGHEEITWHNTHSTSLIPLRNVVLGLAPISKLFVSSVKELILERFELKATVENEFRFAKIKGARWLKDEYEAGEELRAAVILKPYQKELTFEPFELKLPEDLPEGKLEIHVSSGRKYWSLERKKNPGFFDTETVEQLRRYYKEMPDNSDLLISFDYGSEGVNLAGKELPSLPASALTVINNSRGLRYYGLEKAHSKTLLTPWFLSDDTSFKIEIKKKERKSSEQ